MEVRWYRHYDSFNSPVLLYNAHQLQTATQMARYQNRTSLATRDPASGGLKKGDVSIRIERAELLDGGLYVCHVSSSEGYDRQHMFLSVEEVGAPPVMSLSRTADDRTNVSCISSGWYPGPQLQWSLGAQGAPLQPGGLCQTEGRGGLFTVESWVLQPSTESQWVSCSVRLASRKESAKEGRVHVQISSLTPGSSSWLVAFIIALVAVIALAAALFWIIKKNRAKDPPLGTQEEGTPMLDKSVPKNMEVTCWEAPGLAYSKDMKNHAEDIFVDKDTAPSCLKVAKAGKLIRGVEEETSTLLDLCVTGDKCFSEGQHYWEVRLKKKETPVKMSWWVGVATESAMETMRQQKSIPTAGLWSLCSDTDSGMHIMTMGHISVGSTPEILGIFLDYNNGRLSFYDTNKEQHLVTMKCSFEGKVYPIFNPGIGDVAPLEILCPSKSNDNDSGLKT
ncbi:butyrophilin subfamily 2 member A2-like isoform X2 [Engraulis encrasicolus]